jgi:dephospho-CoA kinase
VTAPQPATTGGGQAASTVRIGLTGPIGCGKSTVAGWLGELGARVIDADHVARDVTPAGSAELVAVAREFGDSVLLPDGSLDRAALGRIVFADEAALGRLEAIIHPAVRPRILEAIGAAERDGAPAVIVEAIKLVEGGLAALCDEVWLIVCDPAAQRDRLAGRGSDPADTEARIAAQSGLATRLAPAATRVIDTTGPASETQRLVTEAWTAAVVHRSPDAGGRAGSDQYEPGRWVPPRR